MVPLYRLLSVTIESPVQKKVTEHRIHQKIVSSFVRASVMMGKYAKGSSHFLLPSG